MFLLNSRYPQFYDTLLFQIKSLFSLSYKVILPSSFSLVHLSALVHLYLLTCVGFSTI